jgi:hypothetical protein
MVSDIVSRDPFASQRQRPMNDDLLAKGRGDDVVAIGEGLEDALGHHFSKWRKKQLFTHKGHAAADDDTARAEQSDDMTDFFSQHFECAAKEILRRFMAVRCSRCDLLDAWRFLVR